MLKVVNAMGDACPIPVVKTKNAIKELSGAGMVENTGRQMKLPSRI